MIQKVMLLIFICTIALCDGGRTCLSCSDVEGSGSCLHHITCLDHEVCYMHHYNTESGKDNYDFGCSVTQVCPTSVIGAFVGKRDEGRHTLCYSCCNDTDFCNQNLQCNSRTPQSASSLPEECSDMRPAINASGVYTIYPFGAQERPVQVFCEVENSKRIWTVIQRRTNGSVDFYRNWESYKEGFGSPFGEYWLGNEVIHALTSNQHHELMINMSDFDSIKAYAEYSTFIVGNEASNYRLFITGYSGDAGDDLAYSNGLPFTTYDRDNDVDPRNCAELYRASWWMRDCFYSDLNGEYLFGHHNKVGYGVLWNQFKGTGYSLRSTMMMVRKT